jgi:cell division septation protein DedD
VLALAGCRTPRSAAVPDDAPADSPTFLVQVAGLDDRDAAQEVALDVGAWWDAQGAALSERPDEVEVAVVWRAPLYRVRLGPFATQAAAQAARTRLQETYPDAFLVPAR